MADETETVEVTGTTVKTDKPKSVEIDDSGGDVLIRTNGWVKLDDASLWRFEKALRRAKQA